MRRGRHLDGEAQVLHRQVAQRARFGPAARRRRPHERREARRVADQLVRVAQQQRLRHLHHFVAVRYFVSLFAETLALLLVFAKRIAIDGKHTQPVTVVELCILQR